MRLIDRCSTRRIRAGLLLAALAMLAACPIHAGEEIERSGRPNSPVRHPLAAWAKAQESIAPGTRIRRLAFADHVLFVFHSAPGEDRIRAFTLTPVPEGYYFEEDDVDRDPSLCRAAGIAFERVEHGLRRVLDSPEWQAHAAGMSSLILECIGTTLEWTLMPVPAGGYREGVAIKTITLPFELGPEAPGPDLERD